MNDLENALHRLIDVPAGPAPRQTLADAALARAAQRSRRKNRGAVAAAIVAVVAVAVGVASVGSGPVRRNGAPAGPDPVLKPRVNVLIVGSDAGRDRVGVRPDTVMVASIDTRTGSTVLFGLPRTLEHVPFPPGSPQGIAMPEGYACPDHTCLLAGIWTWASGPGARFYAGDPHPGLTATFQAAEQVTGLAIDEYVVLQMPALSALVDAVGGVDVDVSMRLPIGGNPYDPHATGWIEPGHQHLNGYQALWYARSRWLTSDLDRMARQRCLVAALAAQIDATTLATRLPALVGALKGGVTTSIDVNDLSAWTALAHRVQHAPMMLVGLAATSQRQPDYDSIRDQVQADLRATSSPTSSSTSPRPAGDGTTASC